MSAISLELWSTHCRARQPPLISTSPSQELRSILDIVFPFSWGLPSPTWVEPVLPFHAGGWTPFIGYTFPVGRGQLALSSYRNPWAWGLLIVVAASSPCVKIESLQRVFEVLFEADCYWSLPSPVIIEVFCFTFPGTQFHSKACWYGPLESQRSRLVSFAS